MPLCTALKTVQTPKFKTPILKAKVLKCGYALIQQNLHKDNFSELYWRTNEIWSFCVPKYDYVTNAKIKNYYYFK